MERSPRARALAAIQIGRKRLGMDDEFWRGWLNERTGTDRASELTHEQIGYVLNELRALGFRPLNERLVPAKDRDGLVRKIRARLQSTGKVDAYADAMARRMFGVERFEWCKGDQLWRLLAALEIHDKRQLEQENDDGRGVLGVASEIQSDGQGQEVAGAT